MNLEIAQNLTDAMLIAEFKRCCACCGEDGIDLTRTAAEHAAIHDCDTGVIDDIQTALFSPFAAEALTAKLRVAEVIARRGYELQ